MNKNDISKNSLKRQDDLNSKLNWSYVEIMDYDEESDNHDSDLFKLEIEDLSREEVLFLDSVAGAEWIQRILIKMILRMNPASVKNLYECMQVELDFDDQKRNG